MDIKETIYNQFKEDRLFMYLEKQGFEDELLSQEFLNYISCEKMYSTIEVAEMLSVSDNDLRYYMKVMRSIEYIKSFKSGRNYRFNYLQIYQMYLVVSILNLPHHTTSDIKRILGRENNVVTKVEIEDSPSIDSAEVVEILTLYNSLTKIEDQIIMKKYEIVMIEKELNSKWRSYLQLDSKFNLALIEIKFAAELKDVNKSGWFSKSNNVKETLTKTAAGADLIEMKEQLIALQAVINDYEKELSIKMQELKLLVDKKKKKLLNG